MPAVIAFDTETHLITPGCLAPTLVCLQWKGRGGQPMIRHRAYAEAQVHKMLAGDAVLVGHNVAFDMGVLAANFPHFLPLIFAKYDRDQVTDTLIREQLVMISRGTFRSQINRDGEPVPVKYHLDDCIRRHFGRPLKKEGFRLFYRAFDEHPDIATWPAVAAEFQMAVRDGKVEWVNDALAEGLIKQKDIDGLLAAAPEEAVAYALEDGVTTLDLYESQEKYFGHLLADQYRQARGAFALHLASAWGVHTDEARTEALAAKLEAEFEALKFELQEAGIIREDGTADTKAATEAMIAACEEEGVPVPKTPKGNVSLKAEYCEQFDEFSIIGRYSAFLTLRKTLKNDIKMLRAGIDVPLQGRYDIADTGRSRMAKPNLQAINRGQGIRECIAPRPGRWFIQADFSSLELHTRAVWCLEKIGWSRLADDLNAGLDVHLVVAADLLGIPYEEAAKRLAAKDEEVKNARQAAKALNFGLPGGLGVKKLIRYAKVTYGVDFTEEQAREYKAKWLARQPEMNEFFLSASVAVNNFDKVGEEEHLFVGRKRGGCRYAALCNGRFQGLGADAAKEALWRVSRACYVDRASPLFGCRPVLFVHDEIICEAPADVKRASDAAKELERLMCEGANMYLHRVPVHAPPCVMTCWSKAAEAWFDEDGNILPWSPEEAARRAAEKRAA